ncbi:MAG: hypothetical protein IJM99_00685 [Firmicutes bacterium]|nr:hypothetical protein [Bacillota bacterium]MBQ6948140.1 hypothetical protein [Bacillota bacterium]
MKKTRAFLIVTIIAMILTATLAVGFGAGTPGSEDDPIVTRSYVEKAIQELEDLFEELFETQEDELKELKKDVEALKNSEDDTTTDGDQDAESTPAPVSTGWQVVQVPAQTTVVGETGTEMILRSGSATAVDNGKNGISDLTAGKDLRMGNAITQNHLLLIPGSDGRGIKTVGMCFVMINGGYTLVQQ